MWLKITKNYSPNFNLSKRLKKKIKFIIIHYTGMKNENLAIKRLTDFKSKVSSHYFIKKNGDIIQFVPDLYEAWHAGKSSWGKFSSLNRYSIGVEIQNSGHDHGYESFSNKQINSLKILLKNLIKKYKINFRNVLGHSDIAPERKKDPGEKFPWEHLSKNKLALWHKLDKSKLKKYRLEKISSKEEAQLLENLYKLGYKRSKFSKLNIHKKNLLKAFQQRFRQSLVNGLMDKECFLICKNLIKS